MRNLAIALLVAMAASFVPCSAALGAETAHAKAAPIRVVYHLDTDLKGTTTALHQAGNQLAADPTTKIVIVAIGPSVRFMVKGSNTAGGYPFALMVQDLEDKGVRIEACGNTMATLKIKPEQLDDGIVVVPSGMAELARLQAREGYVYIRP